MIEDWKEIKRPPEKIRQLLNCEIFDDLFFLIFIGGWNRVYYYLYKRTFTTRGFKPIKFFSSPHWSDNKLRETCREIYESLK